MNIFWGQLVKVRAVDKRNIRKREDNHKPMIDLDDAVRKKV